MNHKEIMLTALKGGVPERVPCFFSSGQVNIAEPLGDSPPFGQPFGVDAYGAPQAASQSGAGFFTPDTTKPPAITDITKWKEQAVFPDFSGIDWTQVYEGVKQFMHLDRDAFVQDFYCGNGIFERLHFNLGFENALVAVLEEPEAVYEYVGAVADKKIEAVKIVAQYFKPDVFTYLDDYAHVGGLFFSKDVFRKIFKPHIKRIVDAVKETGMIYKQHSCGKMEDLFDEFYDIGVRCFDPVQPVNDIAAMKAKHPGEVCFMGGLDIQHVVDRDGVTEEELRAETRRCIDAYAPGGGYIIFGASISMYDPEAFMPGNKIGIIIDECARYGAGKG
ncbi:MAG: hypothetical protein LBR44_10265 [Clostridiales Family XIII bacterium]|nr:hypothetical protein [Clostridiales Family XIII bacterium]